MLRHLLSLMLSSGALAHAEALIYHTWPSVDGTCVQRHTARLLPHLLSLMLSSGALAHATALVVSHVGWPSEDGTYMQRETARLPQSSAVTNARQWRLGSCHGSHHVTRGRQ
jgi:hypothetical protein